MTIDEAKKYVNELSKKASEQKDSGDAMRFSQAACNVANSLCALGSAEKIIG